MPRKRSRELTDGSVSRKCDHKKPKIDISFNLNEIAEIMEPKILDSLVLDEPETEEEYGSLMVDEKNVEVQPSVISKHRKVTNKRNRDEYLKDIILGCEWNMCERSFHRMDPFQRHIVEHVKAENELPQDNEFLCFWRDCGFTCSSQDEMSRHILFHAIHTQLKSVGALVMAEQDLSCSMDNQSRNIIPEIPEPFVCMWGDDCNWSFAAAHDFYIHTQGHGMIANGPEYACEWKGCSAQFKNPSRLKDHIRTHTQEKYVGCPHCGAIFASKAKLNDHCIRQMPPQLLQFECSCCQKKCGSERLLREHVRFHINRYKCPHCDMTCPTKSNVVSHIKYRHADIKPFKCPECPKSFKNDASLSQHMLTHSKEKAFECTFADCCFSCRALTTMIRHNKKVHNGVKGNSYACHLCTTVVVNAYSMTLHLFKKHNLQWPAGHNRFRYKLDEDGYFRLQTVRYESYELGQSIEEQSISRTTSLEGESDNLLPEIIQEPTSDCPTYST